MKKLFFVLTLIANPVLAQSQDDGFAASMESSREYIQQVQQQEYQQQIQQQQQEMQQQIQQQQQQIDRFNNANPIERMTGNY